MLTIQLLNYNFFITIHKKRLKGKFFIKYIMPATLIAFESICKYIKIVVNSITSTTTITNQLHNEDYCYISIKQSGKTCF